MNLNNMSVKLKPLLVGPSGAQSQIYPYTHEKAVIDDNGTSLETKLQILSETYGERSYLLKTTYEYNVEINNVSYIQLDYIEATSKAYIDTGIVPNDSYGISIRVHPSSNDVAYYAGLHDNTSTDTRYLIGTYNSYVYYGWGRLYDNSSSSGHYKGALSVSYNATNNYYLDLNLNFKNSRLVESQRYYMSSNKINNGITYSRNVGYYYNSSSNQASGPIALPFTPSKTIWIGYVNDADSYTFSSSKIYNVQISNGSNVIRNYVPCKVPNGTIGMFDTINNVFYSPTYGTYIGGSPVFPATIAVDQPILLGRFTCSNTNVTIEINSADTSLDNYHGVIILSTQNWTTANNSGSYSFNIYGDYGNTLQENIFFRRLANSNICEIYYKSITNCKVLVHIQCVGVAAQPANVCTTTQSIPSDATIHPINLGYNAMINTLTQHPELFNPTTGGIITGNRISYNSNGYVVSSNGNALSAGEKLMLGCNGIAMSAYAASGQTGSVFIEKNGSSESNNLVFAQGCHGNYYNDSDWGDRFVFKLYNASSSNHFDIYVPNGNGTLATVSDIPTNYPTLNDPSEAVYIYDNSIPSYIYPNKFYIFTGTLELNSSGYLDVVFGSPTFNLYNDNNNNTNIKEYKLMFGIGSSTYSNISFDKTIYWLNGDVPALNYNDSPLHAFYINIMYVPSINKYIGSYIKWWISEYEEYWFGTVTTDN